MRRTSAFAMRACVATACFAAACGPVRSASLIAEANAELAAAKVAEADHRATFEFVAAEEYLHKAREEESYAEFGVAIELAKKARDCARLARARASIEGARKLDVSVPTPRIPKGCRPGPAFTPTDASDDDTEPDDAPPSRAARSSEPAEPADPLPEGDADTEVVTSSVAPSTGDGE